MLIVFCVETEITLMSNIRRTDLRQLNVIFLLLLYILLSLSESSHGQHTYGPKLHVDRL